MPAAKTLVLGLGNDLLSDDAVGLLVAREVARRLAGDSTVDVRETSEMGLALLDFIVGYRFLALVDSVQTGKVPPGFVHEINDVALRSISTSVPHFLGVRETLALGKQLGIPMPERVKIFAVEVEDPFTFSTRMTPALQNSFPEIVEKVLDGVRELAAELSGGQKV